ncbi:Het and ankyrin domain protein [Colletotrichum scovillei]|uniref:Het and ankyrin domain protein n=1 Tax=Colletotrichum scovillei TaxID=1209932 RepID=A0A9P7U895_9PEZI|nr:Het and ankyrin domain protein [Colletotrichum scovillei]KAG7046168.1 Het and ankyrin domain protein [Colletotrichum scovillei]KAG7063514.1 Het and ankyrin domain protein [Colletotrichum scovillei]
MQYKNILAHFFIPSILLLCAALTYLYGFLVLRSLMTHGSRFMTLVGAGTFRHARYSTTPIIHFPLDSILDDNRTYSVINQNELLESVYHDAALQLICFFARSTAEWIEELYRCSLLQNLSLLLSEQAGDILTTLASYFGFPSSLAKEPPTKHSAKIQKQQPKGRAQAKGSAKNKGKGRATETPKTPVDGPEDSESGGEDSDDSDEGENTEGCRHIDAQVMACPFYKLDPIKYYECVAGFRFTAFRYLKQHMLRNHCLTDIYCPMCWETFKTAMLRDQHVRRDACQSRRYPESFTVDEVRSLKKKIPGKLSDEEKYFRVWDQFFAAHPRPKSLYVDEGIWEPFSLLVGIAKRNITNAEFSRWAMDSFCPPCEDVLLQLLTLRHEHTRISRHVSLQARGDTSIPVKKDTHLTVLRSNPSNPNETTYVAPLWPNLPAIALDANTNMLNVFPPSAFCEPGLPESSGSGSAASLSMGWNPAIGNIADIRDPGAIPPSDTSGLTGLDGFVDLDDGSRQEKYQE